MSFLNCKASDSFTLLIVGNFPNTTPPISIYLLDCLSLSLLPPFDELLSIVLDSRSIIHKWHKMLHLSSNAISSHWLHEVENGADFASIRQKTHNLIRFSTECLF